MATKMTKTRLRELAATYPLTAEEKQVLFSAAHAVWNYIGCDCFGEGMPKSMPRSQVIELVLDADRLAEQLHRRPERLTGALAAMFPKDGYDVAAYDLSLIHI